MLGKRPRPMIGKISELLVPGNRADTATTSPRSPLDLKMQSPRGLKNYDLGGVGLGIVAALEKSGRGGREILAKYAICGTNLIRSEPIPVNSGNTKCERFKRGTSAFDEEVEGESLENYTYVTCRRGPNQSPFTRVYYDGGERVNNPKIKDGFGTRTNSGIFHTSPPSCTDDFSVFPTSDHLSSCHLCRKNLHGKDIYMYRGEKAFCSTECRSRQIMMDERKERCRSEASRSVDVASSSYGRGQIFSTGIFAS